ncbi:VOC family protein [Sporosarcina thermotolerans]|uniref:VOC family protein n=1 Tax=Sporosarcina thermotolerans TaxID=633404 RepID=A0AAW9AEL7_9BACL|nr:VOC family protein [Sporosarcina thermotolerans]MDW0118785.1 VOC family protein [Sporosarcina thermotolerans]WHT48471.1 VOC family protein [Sporosarcina thermotolerans]
MTQVCVISIYVPDMQKALGFYTGVLGFEVNKEYGSKIVTLVHGELPIVLEEMENAVFNRVSSGVVLTLKTDDIHQSLEVLKEHDVELIIGEPADCPPGKYISFRDPFGNVWEYLQFG